MKFMFNLMFHVDIVCNRIFNILISMKCNKLSVLSYIYIFVFVGCVVLAINKSITKGNKVTAHNKN